MSGQGNPEDRGIIRPLRAKGDPRIHDDAIMVMIRSELDFMATSIGARAMDFSQQQLYRLYRAPRGSGKRFTTLAGPFLGAPFAVMGMEKLVALGARRIWILGWCGSLQPSLPVGSLIIPSTALSEEGTSAHYPVSTPPQSDPRLIRALENELAQEGLAATRGRVWTTDGVYRETPEKVLSYQKDGVLAVEMEFSALMTVAAYRGISLAGLLVVSDELFDLKWHGGFSDPLLKTRSHAAGQTLLRTARLALEAEKADGT